MWCAVACMVEYDHKPHANNSVIIKYHPFVLLHVKILCFPDFAMHAYVHTYTYIHTYIHMMDFHL